MEQNEYLKTFKRLKLTRHSFALNCKREDLDKFLESNIEHKLVLISFSCRPDTESFNYYEVYHLRIERYNHSFKVIENFKFFEPALAKTGTKEKRIFFSKSAKDNIIETFTNKEEVKKYVSNLIKGAEDPNNYKNFVEDRAIENSIINPFEGIEKLFFKLSMSAVRRQMKKEDKK